MKISKFNMLTRSLSLIALVVFIASCTSTPQEKQPTKSPFNPAEIKVYQEALNNIKTGELDKAIERYLKAYEVATTKSPASVPAIEQELGIAYLHKSEMENDLYHNPGDRCLLPFFAHSTFAKKDSSQKAIEYLLKHLDKALSYIRQHKDAWICTAEEILDSYTQNGLAAYQKHLGKEA